MKDIDGSRKANGMESPESIRREILDDFQHARRPKSAMRTQQ
jgi:hypothetical protein